MRVIHLMGATNFTDPDTGTSYEAGPDGVFELPEHVGTHYTTRHAGMFRRESDHEALIAAKKAEALANPHNTAPTLKALLERVTVLEGKVAAWEEFFGGETPPPDSSAPDSPEHQAAKADAGAPAEPEANDSSEPDDKSDDEPDPTGDAPLRKPTPRKTTAKRRS